MNRLLKVADVGEKILAFGSREAGGDGHILLEALIGALGVHIESMPARMRAMTPTVLLVLEENLKLVSGALSMAHATNEAEKN